MSMDLRPVDLPRLRDDLIAFAGTDVARQLRALDVRQGRMPDGTQVAQQLASNWRDGLGVEIEALRRADLFYVTRDLVELAGTAARSLPSFSYEPTDVPSREGLMWLGRSVQDIDEDGHTFPIAAAGWYTNDSGVLVMTYVVRDEYPPATKHVDQQKVHTNFPAVFPIGCCAVPFGADPGSIAVETRFELPGGTFLATVKSVWLLMRQPLAEVEHAHYDRATRRRIEREGKEPPPVRVISLRRPAGSGSAGEGGREWLHSWMVRGHWRMQAHGAGRKQHRPVWIAPHVKGPADKPLLGGEKVYTVAAPERRAS
jgi:hypothetical protein